MHCTPDPAEAEKTYGEDKLKIYKSKFTPLYHGMTTRKTYCHMKLITVKPDEKVKVLMNCTSSLSIIHNCSVSFKKKTDNNQNILLKIQQNEVDISAAVLQSSSEHTQQSRAQSRQVH